MSVKFFWDPGHRRPHNQIFVGFGPQHPTGSAPMVSLLYVVKYVARLTDNGQ